MLSWCCRELKEFLKILICTASSGARFARLLNIGSVGFFHFTFLWRRLFFFYFLFFLRLNFDRAFVYSFILLLCSSLFLCQSFGRFLGVIMVCLSFYLNLRRFRFGRAGLRNLGSFLSFPPLLLLNLRYDIDNTYIQSTRFGMAGSWRKKPGNKDWREKIKSGRHKGENWRKKKSIKRP